MSLFSNMSSPLSVEYLLLRELLNKKTADERRDRRAERSVRKLLEDLKESEELKKYFKEQEPKKEEKKPTSAEKFQSFMAHWGYLCVLGVPVGLATLGGLWAMLYVTHKVISTLMKG